MGARGAALVLVTQRTKRSPSEWFHVLQERADRAKTREASRRLEALADILFDIACTLEGPESVGGVEI